MKCAYCKYSVPVRGTYRWDCTYNVDDSKRVEKCDETLQFMWMYNKERGNQDKGQTTTCKAEKILEVLERDKSIPEMLDLPNSYRRGYITGLNAAIKIVKAGGIDDN